MCLFQSVKIYNTLIISQLKIDICHIRDCFCLIKDFKCHIRFSLNHIKNPLVTFKKT